MRDITIHTPPCSVLYTATPTIDAGMAAADFDVAILGGGSLAPCSQRSCILADYPGGSIRLGRHPDRKL
jgi:hypothetical protein